MGCKVVRIGDVAAFRKESVKPEAGAIYHCYSFPHLIMLALLR